MTTSAGWRDNGWENKRPKFGRKARAWFGRRLATCLPPLIDKSWRDAVSISHLVGWFLGNPERYVRWIDEDGFRGPGFSNGCWQIVYDDVMRDMDQAMDDYNDAVRAEKLTRDAQEFPTLEAWLRADIAGTLSYQGARGGTGKIPQEILDTVSAAKQKRERRADRHQCSKCREYFQPERQGQHVRCSKCIDAEKSRRRASRSTAKNSRGVYFVGGGKHYHVWSVNARGEKVSQRDAEDGASFQAAAAALWDELDKVDRLA